MLDVLTQASEQWRSRPNDERYLDMDSLKAAVALRKQESWTAAPSVQNIRVGMDGGRLGVTVYDPTKGEERFLNPTNYGFGQLCAYAKSPAAYLRTLPNEFAGACLQWKLEHDAVRENALVLAQSNGSNHLRALTSTSYGRIWDAQVVHAVEAVNADGRWKIPAASYATKNPKRATTLYASDRDVFIFLVDDQHPIEVGGETLFRGFFTWNSEVGNAVFGLCTFLYRFVCDNRMIWGATNVQELRIRHTGGAPERFRYEGARYLRKYSEESALGIESQVKSAMSFEIPQAAKPDGVENWLKARGFTSSVAKSAVQSAQAEEGEVKSLWNVIQGLTAHARTIPYTNERTELETKAGKLMELVGKA
jgi:hypothetical protein